MVVENSEMRLVWPPALFRAEAAALLKVGSTDAETMGWLLDEAFAAGRAAGRFDQVQRQQRTAEIASTMEALSSGGVQAAAAASRAAADRGRTSDAAVDFVRQLAQNANALPRLDQRRYYPDRHRTQPLTLAELTAAFARLVGDLAGSSYFVEAFGSCADDRRPQPEAEGQRQLAAALHTDAPLWPLERDGVLTGVERDWDEVLFFGVVEALHDRTARPRRRIWHKQHRHHHYAWFAPSTGRAVYRWRVNELFARSETTLQLAESGPDIGLLVHSAGDARDDLVQLALATPELRIRDRVEHAVAQFRRRNATLAAKREATRALADVLEERRALLKMDLFDADSNALFQIANKFDIRHMNEQQKSGYNPALLDWVFWWYLATVELTDRLLAEQDPTL